ncbi:MAG: helix-turn-helix domain-containing protein [Planctomycetota bacterium]
MRLSPKELAERWGVSSATIVDMIDKGRLPAIDLAKPGARRRLLRVSLIDVEEFEKQSLCQKAATRPPRPKQYRMKHLVDKRRR